MPSLPGAVALLVVTNVMVQVTFMQTAQVGAVPAQRLMVSMDVRDVFMIVATG
jgi:hypothetical protein